MAHYHRTLAGLLILGLALLAGSAEAADHTLRWHLGHENLDYFEEAALDFKKAVEKGSGGALEIEIVLKAKDGAAAGPDAIAAKVAAGEVEMGHSFTDIIGGVDGSFHAFEAPFLLRGYRHLEGVFEGPVGEGMLEKLRAKGLRGLSFTYSGGANGIATKDKLLRRPEDLKGLKIGALDNAVNRAWLSALGAEMVPIEHDLGSEDVTPVHQGLDGIVITWRNLELLDQSIDFKYMNLVGSSHLVSVTYINDAFFASLPEKHRDLLVRESRKAGVIERFKTIELNARSRRLLEGRGVRRVNVAAANRARFEAAVKPAYAKVLDAILGEDLLRALRAVDDAPDFPALTARSR